MRERLNWETDGVNWPNREASRFVTAGGVRWHVQVKGQGPVVLLIHGTGASTHSWRDVLPLLAKQFTVVAPDLPGHAFTSSPKPAGHSLPGMAESLGALLQELGERPERAAGHSAGAAILVRMGVDKIIVPSALVSFNGAFFPFAGAAEPFLAPISKFIARNPLMPKIFTAMADQRSVEKLLRDTGSRIDQVGLDIYRLLFSTESHVAGTLAMMAAWDLHWMGADLRRLAGPLYLVKAMGDLAIAPASADRAAKLARNASIITLTGVGHLAHEENPGLAGGIIASPEQFSGQSLPGQP